MGDESPLTSSMQNDPTDGPPSRENDAQENEEPDVLAEAIQRWGRRHQSKVSTLVSSQSQLNCLQGVALEDLELDEKSSQPDKKKRSKKPNKTEDADSDEKAETSLNEGEDCQGELSPDDRQTMERQKQERGLLKGIIGLNIRQRLSDMFSKKQKEQDVRLAPSPTLLGDGEYFDGPLTSDMQRKIEEKMRMEGIRRQHAEAQVRVERLIKLNKDSMSNALFYILDKCPSQSQCVKLINGLLKEGLDIGAGTTDDDGRSPLHCVVERNESKFIHLVNILMENDATAEATDSSGRLAVETALEKEFDEMSALILKNMTKFSVRALFEPTPSSKPRFNFYDLIASGNMDQTCHAVLESFVEQGDVPGEYIFFYSALEADENGHLPTSAEFNRARTTFQLITENKELASSNVVRMLIHSKWNSYGEKAAWREAVLYFLFVFVSSFALISAARQHVAAFNVTTRETASIGWSYTTHEARFRGICEIVGLCWVGLSFLGEFKELRQSGLKEYLTAPFNYVQMGTNLLVVALVPMRFLDLDEQFEVAAVLYILICLRMLDVVSITKIAGIYLQILIQIVIKDMTSFAVIFSIFWIMFSGSFFLVLASTDIDTGDTTGTTLDVNKEASDYPHILLTGLRIMVQVESVLDYIDQGYDILAIFIMMCFLFIVLVVILNILIAQLSDTYADVKSDATRTLERNWAKALTSMEQAGKLKALRLRSFVSFQKVEHPEGLLGTWDAPLNRQEALQAERKQRYIEQQLGKQEQQLASLRSQMRTTMDMVEAEQSMQRELQKLLKNMLELQLPAVMENVVERNSQNVISTVDTSSKASVMELEKRLKRQVVHEVQRMIEGVTDEVVDRIGQMLPDDFPV